MAVVGELLGLTQSEVEMLQTIELRRLMGLGGGKQRGVGSLVGMESS